MSLNLHEYLYLTNGKASFFAFFFKPNLSTHVFYFYFLFFYRKTRMQVVLIIFIVNLFCIFFFFLSRNLHITTIMDVLLCHGVPPPLKCDKTLTECLKYQRKDNRYNLYVYL